MTALTTTKPFDWLLNTRWRWAFHAIFWLLMYADEFLSLIGITEPFDAEIQPIIIGELLMDMALVYLNLYILIPFLLLKSRFSSYILATLVSIIIVNLFNYYCYTVVDAIEPAETYEVWITDLLIGFFLPTMTLLGTAIAAKLLKLYAQNINHLKELETNKLEVELDYLKNQINPHFLFNALNNIYVQVRKRPQEAGESVLLLSDLLRYQLYDCTNDLVPLKSEIEYLKNYIALQQIRKTNAPIDFKINGNIHGKLVTPFIFMPFVENAVKYGWAGESNQPILIQFDIQDKQLHFTAINGKTPTPPNRDVGGIGLTNVQRRLNLLYPTQYDLKINDKNSTFRIDLDLPIHSTTHALYPS